MGSGRLEKREDRKRGRKEGERETLKKVLRLLPVDSRQKYLVDEHMSNMTSKRQTILV